LENDGYRLESEFQFPPWMNHSLPSKTKAILSECTPEPRRSIIGLRRHDPVAFAAWVGSVVGYGVGGICDTSFMAALHMSRVFIRSEARCRLAAESQVAS
jgi:hypothetical protein